MVPKKGHLGAQICGHGVSLTRALAICHEACLVRAATFPAQIILYKDLLVQGFAHMSSHPISLADTEDTGRVLGRNSGWNLR